MTEASMIFSERRAYSETRLAELSRRVAQAATTAQLDGLSVFTVGSYGRLEASDHSDIDLFFIYEREISNIARRTSEMKFFGRLIEIVEDMQFPALSNDAEFLESHLLSDVLQTLGGRSDDARNHFTMRMLLLLESRSVHGQESYNQVVDEIIRSYYRDYPSHESVFRPWFLLNDIMRFWKTLLLNYEHKRNRPAEDAGNPKPRVKNFKLKYSRATTCFATICAIASSPRLEPEDVRELVTITPQERLARVAEFLPSVADAVERVQEGYSWFLEQTGLATDDLTSKFVDRDSKAKMFERANAYDADLFALVRRIDEQQGGGLIRALVL